MASNTENLNLLMKNPSTDGADTFNVDTMLNENWQKIDNNAGTVAQTLANILKPTTPPIIGLPPSTTPDGMFQALGNTGELHVWRKTVTNQQAGYDLSDVKTNGTLASGEKGYTHVALSSGSSVLVSSDGYVTIDNPNNQNFYATQSSGWPSLSGKFIKITDYAGNGSGSPSSANSDFQIGTILYIPSGGNIAHNGSGRIYLTKYQIVTGHGAETTTTYPVSTNPNAYQEGDDAKEAGYVVGDVVTGENILSPKSAGSSWSWNYSDSVSVDENGVISLVNQNSLTLESGMSASSADVLIGKYVKQPNAGLFGDGYLLSGGVFYIPNNAVVTQKYGGGNSYTYFTIDRYQPVTGYAAIPAGTTIEYLGKLGDKARVRVVSYVGTGTYGAAHPTTVTFDFAPKVVLFLRGYKRGSKQYHSLYSSYNSDMLVIVTADLSEKFTIYNGFGYCDEAYAKKDTTGRVISWYNKGGALNQANENGITYYFLAIS